MVTPWLSRYLHLRPTKQVRFSISAAGYLSRCCNIGATRSRPQVSLECSAHRPDSVSAALSSSSFQRRCFSQEQTEQASGSKRPNTGNVCRQGGFYAPPVLRLLRFLLPGPGYCCPYHKAFDPQSKKDKQTQACQVPIERCTHRPYLVSSGLLLSSSFLTQRLCPKTRKNKINVNHALYAPAVLCLQRVVVVVLLGVHAAGGQTGQRRNVAVLLRQGSDDKAKWKRRAKPIKDEKSRRGTPAKGSDDRTAVKTAGSVLPLRRRAAPMQNSCVTSVSCEGAAGGAQ